MFRLVTFVGLACLAAAAAALAANPRGEERLAETEGKKPLDRLSEGRTLLPLNRLLAYHAPFSLN